MSATKKSTNAAKGTARPTTTRKAGTRKATSRRATTRKSTSATTRRRTTARTRRAQPKVATTVGAALGTLVVTLLLDASWPVRIGLVLLALVLVGGSLYLQGRRHDAAQPPDDPATLVDPAPRAAPAPPSAPPATPPSPSSPSSPPLPPTEDTP